MADESDVSSVSDVLDNASRRRLLSVAGTGLLGSVAGCIGGSETSNPEETTTETATATEATETEDATETETGETETETAETEEETATETTESPRDGGVDMVVASDGSGDFESVQAAIDAVPDASDEETRIRIEAGTYKEKLTLHPSKTNVTFVGDGPEETILTYDDHAGTIGEDGEPIGTSGSSSFFVFGDGFTARDLTFRNNAEETHDEPVEQAVAIRVNSDRSVFENCRFVGNQDTLYTRGKYTSQYYHDCYIEGDVDFIFGAATAWFEGCQISCKDQGYVTAASTLEDVEHGYVFNNCRVEGDAPDGSVYLGRPWRPHAKTLFRNSYLGDVIHRAGWHEWSGREETCWYAEYDNDGPGAWRDGRVSWANKLSDFQASYFTFEKVFTEWDPRERLESSSETES